MPNYLCMQRSELGPSKKQKGARPSPTQMQKMYANFTAWQEKFATNLTDMGGRLGKGKLVTTEGITDGSLIDAKELIGGYMIVSAESLDEAVKVASECPGLVSPGSGVWVREIHPPGQG